MSLTSIVSYPDRGDYGSSKYRGNCSGRLIKDLLGYFRPKLFVDPSVGGGTSKDVVEKHFPDIEFIGLDLHSGFNLLRDSLLNKLPRAADYVFWHPPYHNIIAYSGNMWGNKPHSDDLSHCKSPEEFIEKLRIALMNIYDAVKTGGHYSVLIGDLRKNGVYWSIQSDIIQIAPGKLDGVIIKTQHNVSSDKINYSANFVPILHEYCLQFKKDGFVIGVLDCALQTSKKLINLSAATWKSVVWNALQKLGGKANLAELYEVISKDATEKAKANPNWQAKVRQTLQGMAVNVERGVWEAKAA